MKSFVNGNIYTLDKINPVVQAMVLSDDGRIISLGDSKEILNINSINIVDLKNKTILPPFNDSHLHLLAIGREHETINLKNKSFLEIIKLIREALKTKKNGEWILGEGYDDNHWENGEYDFSLLSNVSQKNPVFLNRIDHHSAIVNLKVLNLANISRDTIDPNGGKIIKGLDGNPTGILIDNGVNLVTAIMPKSDNTIKKRYLINAQNILLKYGITTFCDMGLTHEDALLIQNEIREKNFGLNYNGYIRYYNKFNFDELNVESIPSFKILGLKVFMDGALGSRGAFLSKPYENENNYYGLKIMDKEELLNIFENLGNKELSAHAIGDGAISEFLDAYETYYKSSNNLNKPKLNLRLEHLQVVNKEVLRRLKKSKITLSIQPSFYQSDKFWAHKMIGIDRMKYSYAWKSIFDTGCPIICGSDAPIDEINPIIGIYNALTRGDNENLTLNDAIAGYTINGANASDSSSNLGRLTIGKFADFICLSNDIFKASIDDIKKIRVEKTYVKGELLGL